MKLTVLGSGTCVPSLKRSSPANFLKIDNQNILVDCGSGTLKQLLKAQQDYKEIDIVFVTHFHTDHISDLVALVQALNWTPGYDRKKNLTLIGPVGFKTFFQSYLEPVCGKPRPNTYGIKIKEISKNLEFNNFTVECAKTIHSDTSVSYKFTEKDKTIIFSGDTDYDENFITFSRDCDLLLLECSFPNSMKGEGHMTPNECGRVAKKAKVKKLVLTHFYPPCEKFDMKKQTEEEFTGEIILAEDLKQFEI